MQNKRSKKLLYGAISVAFWLAVWFFASALINLELILPSPIKVFSKLLTLISTLSFWKTCMLSILRILIGFLLGTAIGILCAVLTNYITVANAIIAPFMTVVRATPVASFIMVLWLMIGSSYVPTFITMLMVAPIIWQNVSDGFSGVDNEYKEVCDAYEVSYSTRLRVLILPTLKNYIIPGIITSSSLGWKSGIAAEIIAYTKNSVGREILNAKNFFESAEMLAWTMVVIILSLVFEMLIKKLGRRFSKDNAKT